MLRVGIVGCGHIGRFHARLLRRAEGVQIVAGADPDRAAAEALMRPLGGKAFADPLEMLDAVALDALYVCSPPMARGPVEAEAGKRGLALFLEKPVAPTLARARRIAATLPQGLIVSVGYNWRYMPHVPRIRSILAKHRPSGFLAVWKEGIPPAAWWRRVATSGGPVVEQASHLLDLGTYLCGPIRRVQAAAVAHRPKDFGDIDDLVVALWEFESGAVGQLVHTCLLNSKIHRIGYDIIAWRTEISGERDGRVVLRTPQGTERLKGGYDLSYAAETAAFLRAVRTGRPGGILCPFRDALASLALGEAIARAARTGRAVTVPQP